MKSVYSNKNIGGNPPCKMQDRTHANHSAMRLYSNNYERLYLNQSERERFLKHTLNEPDEICFLGLILLYTGCRLSEALNIRTSDIQSSEGIVAIKSLKKRDKRHIREVPIPFSFVETIQDPHFGFVQNFVNISRATAWRKIKAIMLKAGISGAYASPKGLRHSFGVHCAFSNIPMPLCQRWMGHADMRTTAIYYQIVGKEEREMAERMW